jgi:hypothetical protein
MSRPGGMTATGALSYIGLLAVVLGPTPGCAGRRSTTRARLVVPFGREEDSFTVTFDARTGLPRALEAPRYRPEIVRCPHCGAPLAYRHPVWRKVVQSLTGIAHVTSPGYRCPQPACPFGRTVHRSARAEPRQVKGSGYGLDVVVRIGHRRFVEHRTRAEIWRDLDAHSPEAERSGTCPPPAAAGSPPCRPCRARGRGGEGYHTARVPAPGAGIGVFPDGPGAERADTGAVRGASRPSGPGPGRAAGA